MIQKAFRDDIMSAVPRKGWHKHFKNGRESVEREPHSGKPATSRTPENIMYIWAEINKDLWLFPKLKSPLKERDFRPSVRVRKMQWGS